MTDGPAAKPNAYRPWPQIAAELYQVMLSLFHSRRPKRLPKRAAWSVVQMNRFTNGR
jgi:hypothetical protein